MAHALSHLALLIYFVTMGVVLIVLVSVSRSSSRP